MWFQIKNLIIQILKKKSLIKKNHHLITPFKCKILISSSNSSYNSFIKFFCYFVEFVQLDLFLVVFWNRSNVSNSYGTFWVHSCFYLNYFTLNMFLGILSTNHKHDFQYWKRLWHFHLHLFILICSKFEFRGLKSMHKFFHLHSFVMKTTFNIFLAIEGNRLTWRLSILWRNEHLVVYPYFFFFKSFARVVLYVEAMPVCK